MIKLKPILILIVIFSIPGFGCKEWTEKEKYERPEWLPGKLYTTVKVQENLSLFTECLTLTGLDKILDISGSWTVFAPTNDAIKQFLSKNNYASISSIPLDELERITKFHIVQNPWTFKQLQSLGVNGWKTGDDNKSNPHAFKRETILRNQNEKYWLKRNNQKISIVLDSTKADGFRKVYVQSRKYAPVFYDQYLKAMGYTAADYRFYFDRDYEQGNVFYAGAKIIKADIFAENGFVHIVDRVVYPMLNAKEWIEKELTGESYRLFLEMVYWYYPIFEFNNQATFDQPEVRQGGRVDSLWDLNYAGLAFDLHSERIINLNQTLLKHNGLVAPTDKAFGEFIDGTLTRKSGFPHWTDHKSLPPDIVKILFTQNFKSSPLFPSTSQYQEIFKKGIRYRQNEQSIIRKEFGSNSTFIGINSYIPDKVFTSVTGPVFCRPKFSLFRQALLYSGAIDAIATHSGKLYFFPISDNSFNNDSSLLINWVDKDRDIYNFRVLNKSSRMVENVSTSTLRSWILNQVGTLVSGSVSGKETFRTLGGNLITWDHTNNTIQGPYPCTAGYKSYITTICKPDPLEEPTDNGKTWSVGYWFNFTK